MTKLLINNIKIRLDDDEALVFSRAKSILKKERVATDVFDFSIYRRSIDARDKNNILLVYSVLAESKSLVKINSSANIKILDDNDIAIEYGTEPIKERPLIVGMGPAGMFCALMLAENGYRPIIIDRGDDVFERTKALNDFILTGKLNVESNVQFGAGGAGAGEGLFRWLLPPLR